MLTKNTDQLKEQVQLHIEADSIVQGIYWDDVDKKGCFIGCLAHSSEPEMNEDKYGIPIMLQRIAERIFESLSIEDAKAFFAAFPDAISCDGKDLSKVSWKFLASELRSLPTQPIHIQEVIDPVIVGMDLLANGQLWPQSAAAADAAAAACAAANAAAWAADSAAWATDAAADAAFAAVWAARAAARAAADADAAAANAARAAADVALAAACAAAYGVAAAFAARDAASDSFAQARLRQKELLLKLISEAEVEQCS